MRKLPVEFEFAGFSWPRYLYQLPRGLQDLRKRQGSRKVCGPYYRAPRPESAGKTVFFYLDSDFSPARWTWADEVRGAHIRHTGWYCDEFQDTKIRGIVVNLPHGRFLAGWSMGEGMASQIDPGVYDDAVEAAYAADSAAEYAAERERGYQEEQEEIRRQEEEEEERLQEDLEHNQGGDAEETEGY